MIRRILIGALLNCSIGCGGRAEDANDVAQGGAAFSAVGGTSNNGGAVGGDAMGGTGQTEATSTTAGRLVPLTMSQYDDIYAQFLCRWMSPERDPTWLSLGWVVDASSSMAQPVASLGGITRWESTRDAVLNASGSTLDLQKYSYCTMRTLVFPGKQTDGVVTREVRTTDTCVDVSRLVAQSWIMGEGSYEMTQMSALLGDVAPMGGTPTLDAYRFLLDETLHQTDARDNYLVLVTDGMPTMDAGCKNPSSELIGTEFWPNASSGDQVVASIEAITQEIGRAHMLGIRTFVIGAPGSEANRAWLSGAAVVGGTAQPNCEPNGTAPYCHIDMTSQVDAPNGIAEMIAANGPWIPCDYWLPSSLDFSLPFDGSNATMVLLDSSYQAWLVPWDSGPREHCAEGYQRADSTFHFCPASCALLQNGVGASFELVGSCPSYAAP